MGISNLEYQTALWSVDGVGLKTYLKVDDFLHTHSMSWSDWWRLGDRVWIGSSLKPEQIAAVKLFQKKYSPSGYLDWLASKQIEVVGEADVRYPVLLKELDDRPPMLFAQGHVELLQPVISVVGTRQITSYGKLVTDRIVTELVQQGASIVSGFMYGVDVRAHLAAHRAKGKTVGVLGFGFDHMYPAGHRSLYHQLLAEGQGFLTEYAPHVRATKGTFIQRNRLVAGMSLAVVVMEAGIKSGSHGTVKWALDYGRSVGAVPGSIANPYSEGTKWLLNEGAFMVSGAADVWRELGLAMSQLRDGFRAQSHKFDSVMTKKIWLELRTMSQSADQLATNCQLTLTDVLNGLTLLELQAKVGRKGELWSCS